MSRRARDERLNIKTDRLKLAIRHAPYWRTIQEGRAIGYRRNSAGKAGTWQARFLDHDPAGARVRKFLAIGTADDMLDADGVHTLNFGQAQEKAREWFASLARSQGSVVEPLTVKQAMELYKADYIARGGKDARGLQTTIDAHILPKLGDRLVADLTAGIIRVWLRGLATSPPRVRTSKDPKKKKKKAEPKIIAADDTDAHRARRASANRILTVLKAALNMAYADGKIESDDAWRRVSPFKSANAPRIRDFTDAEAKRLVNAMSENFRPMVQAALLTGARYGELVRLRAADFNATTEMLHIRAGKTGKARDVALTKEAAKFFKTQVAGKAGNALMLTQADGEAWGKSHQFRPMRAACATAKITPAIGFHILRHSYASRLVMAGVPLGAVAAQIGNSEAICARHYAHHSPKSVADAVRQATAELGIVPDSNVVTLAG